MEGKLFPFFKEKEYTRKSNPFVSRFLQFGSPHTLIAQPEYVATERNEVWVNIGYRVSAFGFLAAESPRLTGNYGFKDQWLGLEWVKANIHVFGGDFWTLFSIRLNSDRD
jgi:hypothetical protein